MENFISNKEALLEELTPTIIHVVDARLVSIRKNSRCLQALNDSAYTTLCYIHWCWDFYCTNPNQMPHVVLWDNTVGMIPRVYIGMGKDVWNIIRECDFKVFSEFQLHFRQVLAEEFPDTFDQVKYLDGKRDDKHNITTRLVAKLKPIRERGGFEKYTHTLC